MGDDLDTEIERAFPEQYEIEREPDFNDIGSQQAIRAQCRFCRGEFATLTSQRTHDCQGTRNLDRWEPPELFPAIRPRVHELGAHLMWATNGLSPYFAIVANFDRVLGKELYFDACGDTWELNHDEQKVKYWEGEIAARDEETFSAYNEYQIGVRARDSVGKRYVSFQFRPGLPDACHVETGDRIQSLPEDTPESIRVQVHSANVDPDEIIEVLHGLMDAMTIDLRHFRREDIHERSRAYNLALYIRLQRELSEEKIVSRNGLLDRLARVSSQQRGRGEYKWNNEEIIGHRNAVALCDHSLEKLLPDQRVGKLLKSYHMKNPMNAADPDLATTHPKLEVQYSTEYSDAEMQSVPWSSAEEYDLSDLQRELDEFLMNALDWAGVTLRADERVYVADEYWDVTETERDLALHQSPIEDVVERERDLAVHHMTSGDLTRSERQVLEVVADSGSDLHHSEIAARSETSSSTVYRTATKLDSVLRKAQGKIGFEDDVIREKFDQLLDRVDDVIEWVENGVESLVAEDGLLAEDSALARWARCYGVEVTESCDGDEIELHGGEFDDYQVRKILRNGYDAARAVGVRTAERFIAATFAWHDPERGHRRSDGAVTVSVDGTIRFLGAPDRTLR